jgi:uncharacterized membrane protein YhiD involved in acid resistance
MRVKKLLFSFVEIFVVVLFVFAIVFISNQYAAPAVAAMAATATETPMVVVSPTPAAVNQVPIFSQILSGSSIESGKAFGMTALEIIVRLLLAVILSAALAFRPRKNVPLFQRNLSVAQTQILLAVVGAALMLIVGDNAARAFAIFAAVSLVRFRTNIRDPKEITILLISLALGLATGVGHWELGLVLCLFAVVLLWFLEHNETEQVFRSMELNVKTRNIDTTQDMLKKIFAKYKIEAEVRRLEPPEETEGAVGLIVYYLNLRLSVSTDFLSEKILTSDTNNIDGLQWEQKKSAANIYQ